MSDIENSHEIHCPQCGHAFSITDAVTSEIRERIETKVKVEARREAKLEIEGLRKKLDTAQNNELILRKKTRELEEKEKNIELDIQRKLDEEMGKIEESVKIRLTQEGRLKLADKDKQLDDMRRQIEDLKRRSEQGSQQMQGEVLELEIEQALRSQFPLDIIDPVPKGMKGGDLVQRIMTSSGQQAGTILWEMKRTKNWNDGWIDKLKDDQRSITAEAAIIVTQIMPKDARHLVQIEGIWISDFTTFIWIAVALRHHFLQLSQAKEALLGKGEKMEFLYSYLTGPHFKQRIESIVDSFKSMQEDLDREKRAIQKNWAVRELQISRMLTSTVGMYGDIQGIVGHSLPKIKELELEMGQEFAH